MKDFSRDEIILRVEDLRTYFFTDEGVARAVDGVSLYIRKGKTLGLVGESGCGKSVTALSIMRLVPPPTGRIVEGRIEFEGKDLLSLPEKEMQKVRGNRLAMIFQEPMTSLNPVYTIGNQIEEAILLHQGSRRREAKLKVIELLKKVGIPSPEVRYHQHPHLLSGGMRQRAMVAMALASNPALLIADEPTTALDVTVQAQILQLLSQLQRELGMSILLITHSLAVIAEMADDVDVMYAGKIMERAPAEELFGRPKNPYTLGLFGSLPRLGTRKERLEVIPGQVPNPLDYPSGCHFRTRCPYRQKICEEAEPRLEEKSPGHFSACHILD